MSPNQQGKVTCLLPHSAPMVTTSLPTKVPRMRFSQGSRRSLDTHLPPSEAGSRDEAMQKLTEENYQDIVIWAKATRLFCPPDKLATGRTASSPEMP